jgi:hypothetical protein
MTERPLAQIGQADTGSGIFRLFFFVPCPCLTLADVRAEY